jgi:hypothetical protein
MTTLATMVARVYRDLADDSHTVFTNTQVEDFVREAITELNRIAPVEVSVGVPIAYGPGDVIKSSSYNIPVELPFRVVKTWFDSRGTYWYEDIPPVPMGEPPTNGYLFRRNATGGTITLPRYVIDYWDRDINGVNVGGYGPRALPYTSTAGVSPTLPLSEGEEYLVRMYGRMRGFDLMTHDRALFAQWQGQTNNTDVSPTQMTQMAGGAVQDWDRQRGLNRVVRKYEQ